MILSMCINIDNYIRTLNPATPVPEIQPPNNLYLTYTKATIRNIVYNS